MSWIQLTVLRASYDRVFWPGLCELSEISAFIRFFRWFRRQKTSVGLVHHR